MNIEDSHVLRTILLVSQLLSWEQCPVHLNFVQTQLYQHLFKQHDAHALAGVVVKGISFYKEVQKDDASEGGQDVLAWHSAVCKSHIQARHFKILQ